MTTAFFETYERLCAQKGMSDNAVAAEIGLSNSTVTSWRNGALPRRPTIKKVADYFGVTAERIMGYDSPKEKPVTLAGSEPNYDNDPVYQDLKRMISEAKTKKTAFVIGYGGDGEVMPVDEEEYQNLKAYLEVRRAKKKQDK